MDPAIVFRDLQWRYEHRKNFALKGINLEIGKNDFIGVVGPNEHGKTTLVSAISGLIPHSYNGIYKGSIEVFGKKVFDSDALELATNVGIVFSDPESQFTAMTVEEELAFGLENMGFELAKIRERIEWAAEITLIQDLLDKSPYDISGGQKQRVAIACVLAMDPPIIIMDEPTSMIDPLGKNLIFEILRRLKEASEHTLIVVEHNVEQLAPLADKMLLMYEGLVDRYLPTKEFFADPSYLQARGVLAPESTEFVQWLIAEKALPASIDLPLDLAGGIEATHQALQRRSSS
jgi:energy-coupling factor transporter ATP-binding protein EcfA2